MTWPLGGLTVYPDTEPTVKVYVPFGSLNVIEEAIELSVSPFKVTDQSVPDGRLLFVKVTAYVTWVNVIN